MYAIFIARCILWYAHNMVAFCCFYFLGDAPRKLHSMKDVISEKSIMGWSKLAISLRLEKNGIMRPSIFNLVPLLCKNGELYELRCRLLRGSKRE